MQYTWKVKTFIGKNRLVLVIILLALLFFHKIILNPGSIIYPASDVFGIYYHEKQFFVNSLKTYNQIPLWDPYVFGGSPFIGNPSSAMFYPLNLLFFILPFDSTFGYLFVIDILIIGIGTYLFAKIIGNSSFGALTSATICMFSGPIILHLYEGHISMVDTFAYFPLLLVCVEKILISRKLFYGLLGSICIAMIILAGHFQMALFCFLITFIYFFMRIVFEYMKKRKIERIFWPSFILCCAFTLGIGLAAIQILPTQEFSRLSGRNNGVSEDFAASFSLHPFQGLAFVFPYFFGSAVDNTFWAKGSFTSGTSYIGILPLFLIVMALYFRRNKFVFIFTILFFLSLIFSMGGYTPLFKLFYYYVPFFNSFRVFSRFLPFLAFSGAILAGFGIQVFENMNKETRKKLLRVSRLNFGILIVAGVFVFLIFIVQGNLYIKDFYKQHVLRSSYAIGINHQILSQHIINDVIHFLFYVISFALAILLFTKKIITQKLTTFFLFFITICDLFLFGSPFVGVKSPQKLFKMPAIIERVKNDRENNRVFDHYGSLIALFGKYDIQNINGNGSLYIKSYRDFVWKVGNHENLPYESFFVINSISHTNILDLLNVKYIIAPKKIHYQNLTYLGDYLVQDNIFSTPETEKKYYLYENNTVLPRAYVVANGLVINDSTQLLKALQDKKYNPKQFVVFDSNLQTPLKNQSKYQPIPTKQYQPNRIDVSVNQTYPGYFILSDTWYPGWKAFDNGIQTPMYRANNIFRAVYLSKGKHEISFRYDPESYRLGKSISIISGIVFILLILANFFLVGRKTKNST